MIGTQVLYLIKMRSLLNSFSSSFAHLDALGYWISIPSFHLQVHFPPLILSIYFTLRSTSEEMYSLKTLTQALLVASIATYSLAAVVPDRDGRHEARLVLPAGLSKDAVDLIKTAGTKALVSGGLKSTINKVQNQLKNNTISSTRAIPLPNITPEVEDLIKTSAVSGLVGGATSATVNGLVNLFKDKDGSQQTRGLGGLSDDDLQLLSTLSRRLLEELD
ncbi:hypothetical protein H4582DRAFT_2201355 [Lactarius indigo]|nr:hypothetical protein H4582DRAFT_2201355 [Lactarius indigo]